MDEKKAEIYNLFDDATKNTTPEGKDRQIARRYFFILLALFIAVVIGALYMYVGLQKDYRSLLLDSYRRAEQLEEDKKFIASKEIYLSIQETAGISDDRTKRAIKRLDKKIDHSKEVLAYQDKIHIKDLDFWRDKYEIKISGNIVNAGKRNLNAIELTVFCLDANDKPVCEESIKTVSSDDKPLKRYQKRPFSFLTTDDKREFSVDIPVVLKSVKGVQVIVTDIDFEDSD